MGTSVSRAFLWMALSSLLFAVTNFLARLASDAAHWSLICATRAGVGALVALVVVKMRRAHLTLGDRTMWLRSVFGTLSMICTFSAIASQGMPLADTVTLLSVTPIFLAVLSPLVLGERGGARIVVALPISVAGVLLVVHPPLLFGEGALGPHATTTAVLALSAAALAAVAMMMLRRVGQRERPEAIAFHFSTFAALSTGGLAAMLAKLPDLRSATFMVGAGVSAGFAQIAMTRAYALERAAHVSAIGYLGIVANAVLGALVLREWPTVSALFGMALVVLGGMVIAWTGWRRRWI